MDKSYTASFEDHYRFKGLIVFMVQELKEKIGLGLASILDSILNDPKTPDLFLQKLGKDMKNKLIPKLDKDPISVESEFQSSVYNKKKKISDQYFASDIFAKPHFLFYVQPFQANGADDGSKVMEYCTQIIEIAASESFKSFFIFTVNLPQKYHTSTDKLNFVFHLGLSEDGKLSLPDQFEDRLLNLYLDMLVKKIAELPSLNLTELDKKRRFADSEECKKLKIYGDFSLLLGSRADAVEYFHWIVEKIYQLCEKKDPKWLAGGYECLVAVQYMILKKKYDFNAEKYTAEKRESAYSKIARALKIYGSELQNYNKAAACFIKFAKFFKIMNMKDYYHKMLTENMSYIINQFINE